MLSPRKNFIRGNSSVVERQLPKLNVAGSNPVSRSRKKHSVRSAFFNEINPCGICEICLGHMK